MVTAYVAFEDRLLVSTGSGSDWTTIERLSDHRTECVAVSPDAPDRVLVGTFESGLYRSEDGGDSFHGVAFDGPDAVTSLAVDPGDPDLVWAGTEPSRLFRSTDGGETWEHREGLTDLPSAGEWSFPPRPHTHHVRWIEPDPHVPGKLYVGIEAGALVIAEDGGESWRDRPEGSRFDNHQLHAHPNEERRVYSAAGDGYAESTDGGDTWSHPQAGLDHRYVWSVAADPADPDRVVVSAARGAHQAHRAGESYVYRRDGDGTGWERVPDAGLPTGEGVLRPVLATTGDPGVVYAATDRGLHRSGDAGETWTTEAEWPDGVRDQTVRGLAVVA